jgi:hypothetical protein
MSTTPTTFTATPDLRRNLYRLLVGAAVGLAYGFALRLIGLLPHLFPKLLSDLSTVMTVGFIVMMPVGVGFVTIYLAEVRQRQQIWIWFLLPWLPMAGALLGTIVTFLEGTICVVLLAPLALILASLGGVLGGIAGRVIRQRRAQNLTLACVMVLPLFTMTWEKPVLYQREFRHVDNVIDIQAPPEIIWRNIERVPPIRKEELPDTWAKRIGFPDPIEATLSFEGLGGVRHASYEKGLRFIETVDEWEPEQRLGFSISPESVPETTLDEHVRVGGPFFDVLHGEYRLEPLGNGVTRLHLSSQHRLSTDFNWYAHLWTDALLYDLQQRIMVVIRERCEKQAAVLSK